MAEKIPKQASLAEQRQELVEQHDALLLGAAKVFDMSLRLDSTVDRSKELPTANFDANAVTYKSRLILLQKQSVNLGRGSDPVERHLAVTISLQYDSNLFFKNNTSVKYNISEPPQPPDYVRIDFVVVAAGDDDEDKQVGSTHLSDKTVSGQPLQVHSWTRTESYPTLPQEYEKLASDPEDLLNDDLVAAQRANLDEFNKYVVEVSRSLDDTSLNPRR